MYCQIYVTESPLPPHSITLELIIRQELRFRNRIFPLLAKMGYMGRAASEAWCGAPCLTRCSAHVSHLSDYSAPKVLRSSSSASRVTSAYTSSLTWSTVSPSGKMGSLSRMINARLQRRGNLIWFNILPTTGEVGGKVIS